MSSKTGTRQHKSKPAPRRPLPKQLLFAAGFALGGLVFAILALVTSPMTSANARMLFAGLSAVAGSIAMFLLLFVSLLGGWEGLGAGFTSLAGLFGETNRRRRSRSKGQSLDGSGFWAAFKFLLWLLIGFGAGVVLYTLLNGA